MVRRSPASTPMRENGQLRADQGAGRAVQDQVLGVLAHRRRDILQLGVR
jgi:hypothetical protein